MKPEPTRETVTTDDIRRWVDAAGLPEVARACGVGEDTVGRWTAGSRIPATRQAILVEKFAAWERAAS